MSREAVAELYEASLRFTEVVETLEVLLDKETLRRLKTGEKQYQEGRYKVASSKPEIAKILSS